MKKLNYGCVEAKGRWYTSTKKLNILLIYKTRASSIPLIKIQQEGAGCASSLETVTTNDSYLCLQKSATISWTAARFPCLILHKMWRRCTLQSVEEKNLHKAHSKTNQCLGRNYFPAVVKILINVPLKCCHSALKILSQAMQTNTLFFYLET